MPLPQDRAVTPSHPRRNLCDKFIPKSAERTQYPKEDPRGLSLLLIPIIVKIPVLSDVRRKHVLQKFLMP